MVKTFLKNPGRPVTQLALVESSRGYHRTTCSASLRKFTSQLARLRSRNRRRLKLASLRAALREGGTSRFGRLLSGVRPRSSRACHVTAGVSTMCLAATSPTLCLSIACCSAAKSDADLALPFSRAYRSICSRVSAWA